jgi:flavin-dependent dehydrogenase
MLQRRSDSEADPFDVVVVGARCAGSPLAALLASRGLRVCLVDRDDFPSDTPSTHGIQPVGAAEARFAADPATVANLLRVLNHELPPSRLFTPGFALSILGSALRHGRGHRRTILAEARDLAREEFRRSRLRAQVF